MRRRVLTFDADHHSLETTDLTSSSETTNLADLFLFLQFPDHGLNRLNERLLLFKHEYNSEYVLLPINVASDVAEGALVEIVVSGKSRK